MRKGLALLAIVLTLHAPGTATAQPVSDRSLNVVKPPETEAKPAASTNAAPDVAPLTTSTDDQKIRPPDTNAAPDISSLTREQLEGRVKTLTENLASANAESESFRQQWQDLKLRDEALGVQALTVDQKDLEEKLVAAVQELYQSEMKRREALQLLDKLRSSTDDLLQTAPNYDPKVRGAYEVASRSAKDYLAGHSGATIPLGNSLSDGRIADVNDKLNSVVLNIGKEQGVKEGMPFLIYRDDTEIGKVKVVLARELVSAAVVDSLKAGVTLKIGDRATVNAEK